MPWRAASVQQARWRARAGSAPCGRRPHDAAHLGRVPHEGGPRVGDRRPPGQRQDDRTISSRGNAATPNTLLAGTTRRHRGLTAGPLPSGPGDGRGQLGADVFTAAPVVVPAAAAGVASGNTGMAPPRPNSAAFSSASTAECIGTASRHVRGRNFAGDDGGDDRQRDAERSPRRGCRRRTRSARRWRTQRRPRRPGASRRRAARRRSTSPRRRAPRPEILASASWRWLEYCDAAMLPSTAIAERGAELAGRVVHRRAGTGAARAGTADMIDAVIGDIDIAMPVMSGTRHEPARTRTACRGRAG